MTPPSRYKSKSRNSKIRIPAKYYLFPEGSKTEILYFEKIRTYLKANLEVIPSYDTATSDPENLGNFALDYLKINKIKLNEANIAVFVFDLEMGQHNRYEKCRALKRKFADKSAFCQLYVSNPCIELWFIMHDENFTTLDEMDYNSAGSCKKRFGEAPFHGNYDNLYEKIDIAAMNAKEIIRENSIDVNEPCLEDIVFTNLYLLFEELNNCNYLK